MSPPSASSYVHKARPRQQGQKGFCRKHRDEPLINNRQAGRRRGRNNNPRQQGGGNNRGNGDSGNRIDNRARGNAAQLLEKYRNMARDAQMSGDRVNAEYYLQFADHYFRVLADNRTRQEEQQQRFQRNDEPVGEHYESSSDDGFESMDDSDESDSLGASNGRDRDYQNRGNDSRGNDDGGRNQLPRDQQPRRDGNRSEGRNEPRNDEGRDQQPRRDGNRDEGRDQQPRREGNRADEGRDRNRAAPPRDRGNRDDRGGERRPRVANDVNANDDRDDEGTIPLAALPPAIGRIEIGSDEGEAFPEAAEAEAPKPRRGRRPRPAEAAE